MFTAEDRYRVFTRAELQDRLGTRCKVEWFLSELRITVRCKGRLILGSDVLRALDDPPSADTNGSTTHNHDDEAESARAPLARPQRGKCSTAKQEGTCASIELLSSQTA